MSLIWSDSVCPIARAAQPSMSTKIQVVHSSLRMGTRFSHRRNYESVREPYSYSAGLGNLKITLSFSAGGNTRMCYQSSRTGCLIRIIREGAESGVWGDEIAPKMIVAA